MKITTIATARIRKEFFQLIELGIKKYEVRSESLEGVDAMYFLDDKTDKLLTIRLVESVEVVNRSDDARVLKLSAIEDKEFRVLFPSPIDGGPSSLWIAKLGPAIDLNVLLG